MGNGEHGRGGILLSVFETLLQGASDIIYVKDEELKYVGASQGFCDLFGLRNPASIVGKTDFDLFPRPIAEATLAEDRMILENTAPDAARFDIFSVTRMPVVSPDGRVIGLYGVIGGTVGDQQPRVYPKASDYRLKASLDHPIRLGGTFVALLKEGLPIANASLGFFEMLGRREGVGWIDPEDASLLLDRARGKVSGALALYARLLKADGEQVLARLECRGASDGTELIGTAFSISEKLAADQTIEKLRTANAVIERLALAEFDWVSLIDARKGDLFVIGCANVSSCIFPDDHFNYISGYEEYFRERVIATEVEDCVRRISLDAIKAALEQSDRYELSYSIHEGEEIRRKRWLFSYLDESRDVILHMRSDVTNAYMMQFDPVSGLYNRHHFQREARKLLDMHPEHHFLFVRFDIDNFRTFNDLYGAAAGNRLIASVKDLFSTFHTPLSICGHIEADHFACIMPEEEFDLMPSVGKILDWLKFHSPDFDFSPKIGVYDIDDLKLDITTMSNRAFLALNSIKGKYGVHIAHYTETMRKRMMDEQSIVNEMGHALENGEFEPYIQPQYDYRTGAMIGAEILLRWNHPEKGLLAPKDFVPVFERNGFITQIDKHVWETACRFQRAWMDRGLHVVPLSVNISRADINDPELCCVLKRLIGRYEIDTKLIRFEITETAYMNNPEKLIEAVKRLRAMGFVVEMDDFGSGYSSLNMLRDVEVDVLKLDMSFLRDVETGLRGDSILRSVIRMARLLRIPVIAEGVETAEQAEYLSHVGCRLMQGYYFARPMPAAKFEERLIAAGRG